MTDSLHWDRDVSGNGDVLPVMFIDPFTFEDLIERLPPMEQDENRIVIETPRDWRIY